MLAFLNSRAPAFATRACRLQNRKGTKKYDLLFVDIDEADKLFGASLVDIMYPGVVAMILFERSVTQGVI